MTPISSQRRATLANGASVPIERAAAILGHLESYLSHPDTEWEVVFYLREMCLERPIDPEQCRALIREGLLTADGRLEDDVRAVVLASVRGEGRSLRVSSPFTDRDDRAVADFLKARDYIESFLPSEEASRYLNDQQMKAIQTATLPVDPQTILDRILRKGQSRTPPRPDEPQR